MKTVDKVDATLTPTRAAEVQITKGNTGGCANGSPFDDCHDPNPPIDESTGIPKATPTPGYPPNAGPCGNDSISIDCGPGDDAGVPKSQTPVERKPEWEHGCTKDDPCPPGGAAHQNDPH